MVFKNLNPNLVSAIIGDIRAGNIAVSDTVKTNDIRATGYISQLRPNLMIVQDYKASTTSKDPVEFISTKITPNYSGHIKIFVLAKCRNEKMEKGLNISVFKENEELESEILIQEGKNAYPVIFYKELFNQEVGKELHFTIFYNAIDGGKAELKLESFLVEELWTKRIC